jgi:hypothetical protein
MKLFGKSPIKIESKMPWSVLPEFAAPVVTDTQNFYQEFMNRIMQLTTSTGGWGGYTIDSFSYNGQMVLRSVCPHNQSVEVPLSTQMMASAPGYGGGVAMADGAFARMVNVCQSMHAHIPPPGSFVYSLAETEPVGYQTPSQFIPMDDFKKMYAGGYEDLLAQYNAELLKSSYAYSYVTSYADASVGGVGYYGESTPSILGELLKICPGLGSVRRACPDKSGCEYADAELSLSNLIQHVNDNHQWSREKIAEWLDIIAIEDPTVDLTIQPKKKETKRAEPSIGPSAEEVAKFYGTLTLGDATIKDLLGNV